MKADEWGNGLWAHVRTALLVCQLLAILVVGVQGLVSIGKGQAKVEERLEAFQAEVEELKDEVRLIRENNAELRAVNAKIDSLSIRLRRLENLVDRSERP